MTTLPPTNIHRGRVRIIVAIALLFVVVAPRSAPGTVAEQRARLPPPARCTDPVEGIWKSHQYNPMFADWTEFYLEIYRVDGSDTELTGTIRTIGWDAGPDVNSPPPCRGQLHFRLSMEARGRYAEEESFVEFWGTSWQLDELVCGAHMWVGYNLDNFSGVIDPEIQEFQSVNNDGGRAINEPTVFRRIECFTPEEEPFVEVDTPAYTPAVESPRGCSCW